MPVMRSTGKEGKRIVLLSSSLGSLATNKIPALPIYSITKTALNMLGVKLAAELKDEASVMMLHPGNFTLRLELESVTLADWH